jgi:hypothetical protein
MNRPVSIFVTVESALPPAMAEFLLITIQALRHTRSEAALLRATGLAKLSLNLN